ncbi:hypothetical protein, partial [Sulfitobacter sp.]|uniref:hypothetical protein n=1 Tax=Sulfitobacter sp. TaxID=1903071 RepID=UPI003002BB6E
YNCAMSQPFLRPIIAVRFINGLNFIKAELLATCHARLGQTDLAKAKAAEVLRAYPAFRLAHVRLWKNFRNEAYRQNLLGALREAGLPE